MSAYGGMPPSGAAAVGLSPSGAAAGGSSSDTRNATALNAYGGMPPLGSSGIGGAPAAVAIGGGSLNAYGGMPPLGSPSIGASIGGRALAGADYGGMPPSRGGRGSVALHAYGGMPPTGLPPTGGGGGVALNSYGGMPRGGTPLLGHLGDGAEGAKKYIGMPKKEDDHSHMPPKDDYTMAVWRSIAGGEQYVEWARFIEAFQREMEREFSHDERRLLHGVLGDAVEHRTLLSFVGAFGPTLEELPAKLEALHAHPWFFGHLSRIVADAVLMRQPIGTFLVRLSASKIGSFDLVIGRGERSPSHILLEGLDKGGVRFRYRAAEGAEEEIKVFPAVSEVIDWYTEQGELAAPYPGTFICKPYFFGNLGSTASMKLLTGQPAGTFLIRLSSSPGCFTSSFVNSKGTITHSRISYSNGGAKEESSGKTWTDMDGMLEDMKAKGILTSACTGGA